MAMTTATADNMDRATRWVERALGRRVRELTPMPGGAGARRYWRARDVEGRTAILMHALSEDPRILPPALRATPSRPLPFVVVTELLASHGLPVPAILDVDEAARWVLLEDLGDRHLCDLGPADRAVRQAEAVEVLAVAHAIAPSDALPFRRRFDEDWILFELDHFLDYGVAPPLRSELQGELVGLARCIARLPRVLCLRDFQSQNLMIDARGRLRILDYQDALCAPPELDLVALLHDSYVETPAAQRRQLLERYCAAAQRDVDPRAFALLTVQRKAKDFGRFRYLAEAKRDLRFAACQGAARAAVLDALPALPDELGPLREALAAALAGDAA
jgi:aminoglycoside/choline kinase family phosphotransferase